MGFKPMLLFKNGERKGNAQVFATESEARASAKALFFPLDSNGWIRCGGN